MPLCDYAFCIDAEERVERRACVGGARRCCAHASGYVGEVRVRLVQMQRAPRYTLEVVVSPNAVLALGRRLGGSTSPRFNTALDDLVATASATHAD